MRAHLWQTGRVVRFACALALVSCTPLKASFTCASDAQCVNGGVSGKCEIDGACSFPDGSCTGSMRRYGGFAPAAIAGTCVPPGGPPPTCGGAGDACCASGPACASSTLACVGGVCVACVAEVAGGAAHTCALKGGGVFCWGKNASGQLGSGSTTDALAPAKVIDQAGVALSGVTHLVSGAAHTCALRTDGTVACWGDDTDGELGRGGSAAQNPAAAPAALTSVGAVTAGAHHTCAALASSGLAYCWGRNDAGQLGASSPATASMPQPVLRANGTQLDGVVALAAGATHTCAVRSDATLWCWGSNASGELGDGTTAPSAAPVEVNALAQVAAARAGSSFTCALLPGGGVSCWGANASGQSGAPASPTVAVPTGVAGLGGVTGLALGDAHACARRSGGGVSCWGANARGQLGAGDLMDRGAPAAVAAQVAFAGVGAGAAHTCAMAAGGLQCWGADDAGQLGDGQHSDEKSPVPALLACP
jgi:alpha-tubulin suppressor-like RCC1 family protein